jgi:DNA-binding transcriptional MerR regulator
MCGVMYTIGEFASIGRVSVRMLRHYDAIGLIPPARVDPRTGYRRYEQSQLSRLNHVVALRELGFSLDEISLAVGSPDDVTLLRRLLRDRRAALERQVQLDAQRLRRIEARLQVIEGEIPVSGPQIELKALPPVRLAELTVDVDELEQSVIGPVIGPLFDRLIRALTSAGVNPVGPAIAYYESIEDQGGPVRIHAGFPVLPSVGPGEDWSVVELGPVAHAAHVVHHGAMATIGDSWAMLREWIAGRADLRPVGVPREVSLNAMPAHDQSGWVTELQWPVDRL